MPRFLSRLLSRTALALSTVLGVQQASVADDQKIIANTPYPDLRTLNHQSRLREIQATILDDPEKFCITPGKAVELGMRDNLIGKYISSDQTARELAVEPYTRQQTAISRLFFSMAANSHTGSYLAKAAVAAGTILCATHNNNSAAGTFTTPINYITVSFETSAYDTDAATCVENSYYPAYDYNQARLRNIMLEEAAHSYQHHIGMFNAMSKPYHRGYIALHTLALEAHAKLISAIAAADEVIEGDGLAIHDTDSAIYERNARQDIVSLYYQGRDATKNNAALLYPAFRKILADTDFLHGYFLGNAPIYNIYTGTEEPDFQEFARIFDHVPGFKGRMISDAIDTNTMDFRTFIQSLTPTMERDMLLAQFPEYGQLNQPPLLPQPSDTSLPECPTPAERRLRILSKVPR